LGEAPIDLTTIARENGGEFSSPDVFAAIEGTKMPRAHGVSEMPVWGEVIGPVSDDPFEDSPARDAITLLTEYILTIQRD
jgi:hypothetical protein